MEISDLYEYTQRHPEQFAAANCFDQFAKALDGSKPGTGKLLQHIAAKYPGTWDNAFLTIKNHGYVGKALLLPHARKASDIFAAVKLFAGQGGVFRHELEHIKQGFAFVSALRSKDFEFFGYLDGVYDWSPDWLARGEKLRRVAKGKHYGTYARPTKAVIDCFGDVGAEEWDLATFEAIQRDDGRILITVRCNNGFGTRWLALLDAGESALPLLSEKEREQIAAEKQKQIAAWGSDTIPEWTVSGEDRAQGVIGIFEPFCIVVNAAKAEDAKELARKARYDSGRGDVLIKSCI